MAPIFFFRLSISVRKPSLWTRWPIILTILHLRLSIWLKETRHTILFRAHYLAPGHREPWFLISGGSLTSQIRIFFQCVPPFSGKNLLPTQNSSILRSLQVFSSTLRNLSIFFLPYTIGAVFIFPISHLAVYPQVYVTVQPPPSDGFASRVPARTAFPYPYKNDSGDRRTGKSRLQTLSKGRWSIPLKIKRLIILNQGSSFYKGVTRTFLQGFRHACVITLKSWLQGGKCGWRTGHTLNNFEKPPAPIDS